MAMLKRGTSGEPVRLLQAKLNVPVDGDFGPATDKALRDYQQKERPGSRWRRRPRYLLPDGTV